MKSRRDFFKLAGLASFSFLGVFTANNAVSQERKRGGSTGAKPEMLDENSSPAKALNYKADRSKITDPKLKTERQGLAFDKQSCANCTLFQGKPGDKVGGCGIFPGKQVAATGWCTSWMKKG